MLFRRILGIVLVATSVSAADLVVDPQFGLRLPPGFRVSLYASSDLANDISAMTINADGNVVVTGRGYIKTLYDTDGDGVADAARDYGPTRTGGMGLCADGTDLYFVGDGGVWWYQDLNGDGVADRNRERLVVAAGGEHGIHGIRKGPDGWWYLIGGNDSAFGATHATHLTTPITQPEAGALVRFSPDFKSSEIYAHGFRNAYDFDFTQHGDLFTYDSDGEQDFLLPWYLPTRVFQIEYGGHHGWRLKGNRRNWALPPYYQDTVEYAASLGRGSPTGVECYRHYQFPATFRNGVFLSDWSSGRVTFLSYAPNGATYLGQGMVFLDSVGTHGFAPTDLAVTPDGGLLVSVGGRGTSGGIYRIDYVADRAGSALATRWREASLTELRAILQVPQPMAAWSRAYWEPLARELAPEVFDTIVLDELSTSMMRIRAVEILTEIHGGISTVTALAGARSSVATLRARVAWSLGRIPCESVGPILLSLVRDSEPLVRQSAMDAVVSLQSALDVRTVQAAITANLSHPEVRLRRVAARIASRLPAAAWGARWNLVSRADPLGQLALGQAYIKRRPEVGGKKDVVRLAVQLLRSSTDTEVRLGAIRLIMLALGDWRVENPPAELYGPYDLATLDPTLRRLAAPAVPLVMAKFGSQGELLDTESARLLGMLGVSGTASWGRLLGAITPATSYGSDFEYLTVFSRWPGALDSPFLSRVVDAFLSLESKLGSQRGWGRGNWSRRMLELMAALKRQDPRFEAALVAHPKFPAPGHVVLVEGLSPSARAEAVDRFLDSLKRLPGFPLTRDMVHLLSTLPAEEVLPVLRTRWAERSVRSEVLMELAKDPLPGDMGRFLWGMASQDDRVFAASLEALMKLPRDTTGQTLSGAVRELNRLLGIPGEISRRGELMKFLRWQTGQAFPVAEKGRDEASLRSAYRVVFGWLDQKHKTLARSLRKRAGRSVESWEARLKAVSWSIGKPGNGAEVFRRRGCQTCHSGAIALGPSLSGVAQRLAPVDLFRTILFPNQAVAQEYRVELFHMSDGRTYSGLVAHESAETILLRSSTGVTLRLNGSEVVRREKGKTSLMPEGLLDGASLGELADLHAYLRGL